MFCLCDCVREKKKEGSIHDNDALYTTHTSPLALTHTPITQRSSAANRRIHSDYIFKGPGGGGLQKLPCPLRSSPLAWAWTPVAAFSGCLGRLGFWYNKTLRFPPQTSILIIKQQTIKQATPFSLNFQASHIKPGVLYQASSFLYPSIHPLKSISTLFICSNKPITSTQLHHLNLHTKPHNHLHHARSI